MQNKRLFMTEMDFSAVDKPPIFLGTVKQLDGVTLKITPLAGYNPMTMIGVTPKLYAKKPNGEFVYQDVDIDVDLSTSQMTIQCKNFMFSDVGTVEMEIELYDDDDYLRTSPTFEIDVVQKLNQLEMEDLKEGIHISLLEELMDYVAESKDYVERFKELLSEFGDDDTIMLENLIVVRMMLETLSSEVDRLENTIAQAQEYEFEMVNQETARVAAEEKRVQAETDRVNEEAKRRNTEQARVSAENTRVSNENTRKSNEEARQSNETQRVEAETQRQNRYNSFITDAEANANNFENYTNNAKVKEEERKANELDRKSQENRRVSNEVERISNENTRKANEVVREKNETSRQNIFENKVDEVDEKIVELNTTKDNFISSVNTKVNTKISELDNAKSDMANTVSNKVNEVETKFNELTISKQQDAEVIMARDGETSLKARLDRDIEKAKQVYVNVEGSNISTDSSVGYAKDIEILGNTIQDTSNLADIRSVGDTVEGQELYEIDVLSVGKNLFNKNDILFNTAINSSNGGTNTSTDYHSTNFIPIKPNTSYIRSLGTGMYYYDKDYKFISFLNHGINSPSNAKYCRLQLVNSWDLNTFQLEEGTVATPYEPYQEDKLTILSPVQLEKVGDVADRIICKDGVWGVEKNINTRVYTENDNWHPNILTAGEGFTRFAINEDIDQMFNKPILNSFAPYSNTSCTSYDVEKVFSHPTAKAIHFVIRLDRLEENTISAWKKFVAKNHIIAKYIVNNPQFIPLPHSQQVKLRTFANKTNISFGCEIEGTIKAQVPKSLGATVNTHTEQINNLNKELDRVKKLEESTVSTVTTESDFTTVEATSNGYFEDVKLEGKTLVNLYQAIESKHELVNANANFNNGVVTLEGKGKQIMYRCLKDTLNVKSNTKYTLVLNVLETNYEGGSRDSYCGNKDKLSERLYLDFSKIGVSVYTFKTKEDFTNDVLWDLYIYFNKDTNATIKFKMTILEGDHTQNPPSYFEGLKSVGDRADEISVESVGNIQTLSDYVVGFIADATGIFNSGNTDFMSYNTFIKVDANTSYWFKYGVEKVYCYREDKSYIGVIGTSNVSLNSFTTPLDCAYVKYRYNKTLGNIPKLNYIVGGKYQSDKKRLLYYNNETQSWEKPILRQWDSIEKHADGKYYYHQRSGEVVLNGSENWALASGTELDNTLCFAYPKSECATTFNNNIIFDKFVCYTAPYVTSTDIECGTIFATSRIAIRIAKSKLSTQDVAGFKQWLQANNVTVVYQLAQEKVYECTNIDLITYNGETNFIVESGVLSPKTTLKVHSNISNVVKILQEKVSLLESDVKASQEVQDMMILESDMRILDMELALMEHMPITLNLGVDMMLRSATCFNFLKKHIENETYEKEYLENVMNKYLATNRLTQEEYDKLYKLLYPPVYDIELPIEY